MAFRTHGLGPKFTTLTPTPLSRSSIRVFIGCRFTGDVSFAEPQVKVPITVAASAASSVVEAVTPAVVALGLPFNVTATFLNDGARTASTRIGWAATGECGDSPLSETLYGPGDTFVVPAPLPTAGALWSAVHRCG